ncbi:unnamed protein product [Lymnaea stagnalis]|uniref:Uncharacterized protein n=1 Tax=Lymnaea stagnalis TaxID=6523 RepID=A0AAV2HFW7_LYMST
MKCVYFLMSVPQPCVSPRRIASSHLIKGNVYTQANVTFDQDEGSSFMTCDVSFQTGTFKLKSLRVFKHNAITTRDQNIAGLSVLNENAIEIYPVEGEAQGYDWDELKRQAEEKVFYRDPHVDFKSYYNICPSKGITSIGLIVSSYYYDRNEYMFCVASASLIGDDNLLSHAIYYLEVKSAAPRKEESHRMSASDISLIVLTVFMIVWLVVKFLIFCVLDKKKLKRLSAEKNTLEMELARLKGEQEEGPADPSNLSLQQQSAAVPTPDTEVELAAARTPDTEEDPAAAPTPDKEDELGDYTVHCCNIYCN